VKISYQPYFDYSIGCDPELFITYEAGKVRKRKAIVGSELIVPFDGKQVKHDIYQAGSYVRDGVQVELHPKPSSCRESVAFWMSAIFRDLDKQVKKKGSELGLPLKIDLTPVVKLSKGDLMKLSPLSQKLGCNPSLNIYGRKSPEKDGSKYLIRSAAGHIHMGSSALMKSNPIRVEHIDYVRAMDVLVGLTSVLIDRHPLAAERRKVYGLAGEYRTPSYGVEYRTLSNFWLHSYPLFSFVMGMAKVALWAATDKVGYKEAKPEAVLYKGLDFAKVEQAINTNDYDLAFGLYQNHVRPFLAQFESHIGVHKGNVNEFGFFLKKIREAELGGNETPLKVWFKEDAVEHWSGGNLTGHGFENFMATTVRAAQRKEEMASTKIGGVVQAPVIETPAATDVQFNVPLTNPEPTYVGARIE
jgi:hypothetical protein